MLKYFHLNKKGVVIISTDIYIRHLIPTLMIYLTPHNVLTVAFKFWTLDVELWYSFDKGEGNSGTT